jgi:hypothetical protein
LATTVAKTRPKSAASQRAKRRRGPRVARLFTERDVERITERVNADGLTVKAAINELFEAPPELTPTRWADFQDGGEWRFVRGVDFEASCSIEKFRNRAYAAGARAGMDAHVRQEDRDDNLESVIVRFTPA